MMKKIFPFAFMCCLALTFFACQNNTDSNSGADTSTPAVTTPVTPSAQTPTAPANTITTNTGVEHYTCPNGHVGSGGDAPGSCSQCGAELSHNQAYHNATPAQNTTTTSPIIQTPQQQQPAAAKNAAGEWHYVCSAACGGGAGAQGNCPNCGSALSHNQAYHN
jgi:hypothetical protein